MRLLELNERVGGVPKRLRQAAHSGWSLRAADWLLHARGGRHEREAIRKVLRMRIGVLLRDAEVPLKLKVKAVIAAFGGLTG